jgi:hypothetical protein
MKQKGAIKTAASLGIKLKVVKKSSGKVLFPEKLAKANKMLAKLKMPLPA